MSIRIGGSHKLWSWIYQCEKICIFKKLKRSNSRNRENTAMWKCWSVCATSKRRKFLLLLSVRLPIKIHPSTIEPSNKTIVSSETNRARIEINQFTGSGRNCEGWGKNLVVLKLPLILLTKKYLSNPFTPRNFLQFPNQHTFYCFWDWRAIFSRFFCCH